MDYIVDTYILNPENHPGHFGRSVTAFTHGGDSYVSVSEEDGAGNVAYVYTYNISKNPHTRETVSGETSFGRNLRSVGSTIFTGEWREASKRGTAYTITSPFNTRTAILPDVPQNGERSGFSCDGVRTVSGTMPLFGGAAYNGRGRAVLKNGVDTVFSYSSSNPGDRFGRQVRDAGKDQVLIGAPRAQVNGKECAGEVYLFRSDGQFVKKYQRANPQPMSQLPSAKGNFGEAIEVVYRYVLVGAPCDNGGFGSVYRFDRATSAEKEIRSPTSSWQAFGHGLAPLGSAKAVVTSWGAAYILDVNTSELTQISKPSEVKGSDVWHAHSAATLGDRIILGCPKNGWNTSPQNGIVLILKPKREELPYPKTVG